MTKRPSATSGNGFIFKEINENENIKEKKNPVSRFRGHGQSSQLADF